MGRGLTLILKERQVSGGGGVNFGDRIGDPLQEYQGFCDTVSPASPIGPQIFIACISEFSEVMLCSIADSPQLLNLSQVLFMDLTLEVTYGAKGLSRRSHTQGVGAVSH